MKIGDTYIATKRLHVDVSTDRRLFKRGYIEKGTRVELLDIKGNKMYESYIFSDGIEIFIVQTGLLSFLKLDMVAYCKKLKKELNEV